jgi:hemerythrin-like domain-containing protein
VTEEADVSAAYRTDPRGRRGFLGQVAVTATATLAGCTALDPPRGAHSESTAPKGDEVEISPGEDLMQEHGVLERLLLVYDEALRRISGGETIDGEALAQTARLVRRFAEDYHERSEEDLVFPRLEAHGRELTLVATLRKQHARGRELTDDIVRLAGTSPSEALARPLRGYVRMMRPHLSREDTVIFPTFREIIGPHGYTELGDAFEEREHQRLGPHGFEDAVAEVAKLEAIWELGELAHFTA